MKKLILAALVALFLMPASPALALTTIPALPSATTLGGTEQLWCIQSSTDKKCTIAQINTYVASNLNTLTFSNTGLKILDSDASHSLVIVPGSNLTANRNFTLTTGDAARTLDISAGDVTISSFGASLVDDLAATNARTTLGLAIGSDVQAYDATLAAVAAYNTNGLVTQTAADTFTGRTITGTSNRITVTNGSGVSGNPTLDIGSDVVTLTGTQAITNKDLTGGTNTFPTFNQNTTGSAAKWTTARNLAGNSVDGSAAVAFANKFIVQGTTDTGLSAAQFLGALSTGIVKNTTTTGVLSIAASGTDYAPATSGSAILKGNGSGGFSAAAAGTDYQAPITLTTTGSSGAATLIANTLNIPQYSGGSGDVVGPGSATDNAIARFDSTTGKLIQNSAVTVADTTGVIAGTQGVTFSGSTSGTTAMVPTAIAGTTTLTLPAATDTLVGKATTDTLTNKTWNGVVIGSAYGGAGAVSGIMKANGSGTVSAATSGTDYSAGTSALATGIVKSTTSTGALTIAVAGDFPTLNQSTTGSAATLTTARGIYGNNFDGSAALTQIIASTYGGTGNGFTKFSGPASTEKTFTLPNASDTIAALGQANTWTGVQQFGSIGGAVGKLVLAGSTSGSTIVNAAATAGSTTITLPGATDTLVGKATTDVLTNKDLSSGTNTFPTLNQNTTGSAAKWTTARNLAGNSVDGSANVAFANKFIAQGTTDAGLSAAQFLGALSTGIVKNTTTTGVLSIAASGTDYQAPITLTTTGTSGAATLIANTLNIPQYSGGGGGSGDVVGPGSATDNAIARFDSTTGKLIQNSAVTVADTTGVIAGTQGVTFSGSTSGTTAMVPTAIAGTTTLTLPAATDTLVGKATTDVLTNKDLSSGTNTFPTLNQNTTGSAAKWTTARNLAGNSVDGSAAVAFANKFIVQGTTDTGLSAAQFLGALGTGLVKNTTTTGVLSIATAGTDYYNPGGTDVAVADGGTNLSAGTSGGILGYTGSTTLASSVALTANALVLGGGAGATPTPMGSLGTTTTLLHGNAAGAPTFAAVSLTADVSGILPAANGGAGTINGILKANGSGTVSLASAGTDYQGVDAELTAIAGLTSAADRVPYYTGSGTAALATFTSAGRALVDDADAAAQRATLGLKQEYCVAMSDQTTSLTTGTGKAYLYLPAAATVNAVRAYVNTAPTGSTIIVDINEAGTTLMSTTKLSIDASEKTSGTAASAAALTDTSIAANAEITFDIDQIGSTIAGKGLVACVDVTF